MSYFTGTANDPADLLLKLKSHAESIGWMTDRSSASEWCCHNHAGYWSMEAKDNRLDLCGNTGFDAALSWHEQPGSSKLHHEHYNKQSLTWYYLGAGPFVTFHLFATIDYLHVVTEVASGQFRPLFIGSLNKRGIVYEGGHYICAMAPYNYSDFNLYTNWNFYPFDSVSGESWTNSYIRVDGQDGAPSPDWLSFHSQGTSRYAIGLGRGYRNNTYHPSSLLVYTAANALTGGTLLIPCTIYTSGAQSRTRFIGEVPDFAVCRMDYLAPGDTVTVGSDNWRVFPPAQRGADSELVGYAYKVII